MRHIEFGHIDSLMHGRPLPPSALFFFLLHLLLLLLYVSIAARGSNVGGSGSDRAAYVEYLTRHGKDPTRALDPARVAAFTAAAAYVGDGRSDSNHSVGRSFSMQLNEMADWLPHELQARFPAPRPPPPPPSTAAIYLQNAPAPPSGPEPASIDWATSNNPTGRSTIAAVRNQGLCGACWAFVAAASIESLVRIAGGKALPLSVQELVDCDTSYDRGCEGGNPQYAYEYAKLNALTAWDDYPYREMEAPCRRRHFRPRAAVEDYKKLPEHDQVTMRRYVAQGPVAVGICATDRSFMFYAGGVYNAPDCCTTQNHAVLIVGYGHDAAAGLDYWVALNSWGLMWGERGHIRLLRSNDTSGPGQCGLAVSPVAPLGGYVLDSNDLEPTKAPSSSGGNGGDKNDATGGGGAHGLPVGAALLSFLRDYWAQLLLSLAAALMGASFALLAYVSYVDYVHIAASPAGQRADADQTAPDGADTVAAHSTVLYERLYLMCTQHPTYMYDQPQPQPQPTTPSPLTSDARSVEGWAARVGAAWECVRAARRECWLWLFRTCFSAHRELSEVFQAADASLGGVVARVRTALQRCPPLGSARVWLRGLATDAEACVQQLAREVLECVRGPQQAHHAPAPVATAASVEEPLERQQ